MRKPSGVASRTSGRADERRSIAYGASRHDTDHHSWRRTQFEALDRDDDECRRENALEFKREFTTWSTGARASAAHSPA